VVVHTVNTVYEPAARKFPACFLRPFSKVELIRYTSTIANFPHALAEWAIPGLNRLFCVHTRNRVAQSDFSSTLSPIKQ
jgi:hypothetical protein